jgi:hypothetical protein
MTWLKPTASRRRVWLGCKSLCERTLLQYSERLRQHAVDRIVEKDDEGTRAQRPSIRKSENPLYGLPGVIEEGEVEAMETV